MTDIVERLRSGEDGLEYAAADEIERLRLERDEALRLAEQHMEEKHRAHRQANEDWAVLQWRVKTLEVERDRLREALRDIVEAWDWWQQDTSDRCQSVPGDAIAYARAALGDDRA